MAAGGVTPASRKAPLIRLPPRVIKAKPRKNKRLGAAASTLTDNLSEFPSGIRLEPGQSMVYYVQFAILQDSFDINQLITVTPVVIAKGPANLNQLTSQLNPEAWVLAAQQSHALEVSVGQLQLQPASDYPFAGDKVPVTLAVLNNGNVRLRYDTATVKVGARDVTLSAGMCGGKNPTDTLDIGESNKLQCSFDYEITQDDIESSNNLQAQVEFKMFYYKCPEMLDSCRQDVIHKKSESATLSKLVSMKGEVTYDPSSRTYSAPGETLKVIVVLTNQGNTRLRFKDDKGNSCGFEGLVSPRGSSTCTVQIETTQEDLNRGSIKRTLSYAGTPNVDSPVPVVHTEAVNFDAVATVDLDPSILTDTGTFKAVDDIVTFKLGCQNKGNDVSRTTDWAAAPGYNVPTGDYAEVAAAQSPMVTIVQAAEPNSLTIGTPVDITVTFNNTGNVRITEFVGAATDETGQTTKCSTGLAATLNPGGTASCTYKVQVDGQEAFEAGIAHTARLSGKYTNGAGVQVYSKEDAFELLATPAPGITVDLSDCANATGRKSKRE
ncbi:hypothetical protein OEZ86_004097 [Tetradesmus obliquus]|nr:hypothetical protein OEZ86_004097 [Tetradesmus obliquus]